MDNCKGVSTPMTSTIVFYPSPNNHLVAGSLYRRIIDKLHYLSFTHLDVAFSVSKLSQDMHQPFMSHWVERKQLEVSHLQIADQVADLLTKPLPRALFNNHFSKLDVVYLNANLWGRNNG
ncbi:hypothetical protein H5410_040369 [Solanum commersonii]|uniref:Uncharacterized protein n=1 Tax=Solanum commersonii TaxID=4109 RepID=A0A9J5XQQ9_SOLCO|nr:hypothetical protein H5410_040369 [Solanum commersonii]